MTGCVRCPRRLERESKPAQGCGTVTVLTWNRDDDERTHLRGAKSRHFASNPYSDWAYTWRMHNRNPSESHHLITGIGLIHVAGVIDTIRSLRGVSRHLFTGIGLPPGAVAIVTTCSREGIIALSLYRYLTYAWRSCNRYNLFARGVLHHLFTGIGLIPGAGVIVTTCSRKGVLRHLFTEIGLTRGASPQPSFRPSSNTSRSAPFLSASQ